MSRSQAANAWTQEGLQPIETQGLDLVYARPGSDLSPYGKIFLGPIAVSFRRDWEKQSSPGTRAPVSAEDAQRTRDRLAALVREEMVKELTADNFALSDGPGDGVLELDLAIVNLQVNVPDITSAGRVTTYATSAGEMSFVAELRDAATGDVVLRAFDRSRAHESIRPQQITSVDNAFEAHAAASAWARALREILDRERQAVTKTP